MFHAGDGDGVLVGDVVLEGVEAPGLHEALDGDVVFDGDGDAVEGPDDGAVDGLLEVQLGRLGEGVLVPDSHGVDLLVDELGLLDKSADDLDTCQFTGTKKNNKLIFLQK